MRAVDHLLGILLGQLIVALGAAQQVHFAQQVACGPRRELALLHRCRDLSGRCVLGEFQVVDDVVPAPRSWGPARTRAGRASGWSRPRARRRRGRPACGRRKPGRNGPRPGRAVCRSDSPSCRSSRNRSAARWPNRSGCRPSSSTNRRKASTGLSVISANGTSEPSRTVPMRQRSVEIWSTS